MDYYKTLGVNRNASQSDIKRAFKKQAMKHHPDKGGDPKQFQQLNEAYEVLGNEQKKSQYDMFGTTNQQPGGARTWEFRTDSFPDDIGDVFNQFFGGGRSPFGQRQPFRKNRDIIIQTEINLEDVLKGKDLIATYRLTNGKEQSVNINLPAGVRIKRHPKWNRDGPNLHTIEKVNVFDLMIGTKKEITTLDGKKLNISIPKATQPGTVLSITEQGLPMRGGRRGNIYLTIQADIPNITDQNILNKIKGIRNGTD